MDPDNTKPFIWVKKYEANGIKVDEKKIKEIEEENRRRAEENKLELMKIQERKAKRDVEYQKKLVDAEFLSRQKEAEQYEHWEEQEDEFLLRQHKCRSRIRIRDGRAKPIDLFSHYIDVFGPKQEEGSGYSPMIDLINPCDWFNGLRQADLEALEPDLKIYMRADSEENRQYWEDLLEITKDELSKFLAAKEQSADIISLIEGKTISELDDLEDEMLNILRDDDPSIDVSFYNSALSRLRAHRAKTRLALNHKNNMEMDEDNDDGDFEQETQIDFEKAREACIDDYRNGGYSPKMFTKSQLGPDIIFVDYEKEYKLLVQQRRQATNAKLNIMTKEEKAFMDAASKGMNDQEESSFSCEAAVHDNSYSWTDKYQPRKPRYFNRIHTGFEWNKYNQTHYDIDNPPPKVVQGYKFNIFYPDLIDKSKAPTFTLTPCKDDKDFCVIRFSAGPPYEDIAFRIVNREWNNSHKSGYRCQFINHMLQLWFQFKRYRYRR